MKIFFIIVFSSRFFSSFFVFFPFFKARLVHQSIVDTIDQAGREISILLLMFFELISRTTALMAARTVINAQSRWFRGEFIRFGKLYSDTKRRETFNDNVEGFISKIKCTFLYNLLHYHVIYVPFKLLS